MQHPPHQRKRMERVRLYATSHRRLSREPRVTCLRTMRKKVLSSTMPLRHVSMWYSGCCNGWYKIAATHGPPPHHRTTQLIFNSFRSELARLVMRVCLARELLLSRRLQMTEVRGYTIAWTNGPNNEPMNGPMDDFMHVVVHTGRRQWW